MIPTIILSLLLLQLAGNSARADVEVNLLGEWFAVGKFNVTNSHWTITDANKLVVHHPDPELNRHFTIVRTLNGHYILESDDEQDHPDIGTIVAQKPDRNEFSSGLIMTRLAQKTESPYSVKEFNTILSTSIWQYELKGSTLTVYFSDSLNVYGWQSADIVRTGTWPDADRAINWGLVSYLDQFVLHHSIDRVDIVSILIDTVDDSTFKGRAFYDGFEQHVVAHRVAPASYEHIGAVSSILTENEWKAHVPNIPALSEMDTLKIWWNGYQKLRTLGTNTLDRVAFAFSFNPDHTVQMSLNGDLMETYHWFISEDGRCVIVQKYLAGQTFFAELDRLNGKPPKLCIRMDYDLEYLFRVDTDKPERESVSGYLLFELEAQ